uniref:Ell-associated factor Eaf n=1 Tax=Graphocephala atropunctata TaxID=36148 RepID=A0A1B6KXZ0_9HEMI
MNGNSMADKLGLGPEVRELKLGPTFSNSQGTAFHTLRYDFKPASVDESKVATVDVGSNQQVTVTVPHLDGSGTTQTVFKGSHRPYQRECVLIIDRTTGEITLEKLANNIQLKKTRMEPSKTNNHGMGSSYSSARPATPTEKKTSPPQRQSHKPPKSLSMPLPKHSPLPASPSYNKSPSVYKSPPQLVSTLSLSPVAPGSLPMIGLEDPLDNAFSSPNLPDTLRHSPYYQPNEQEEDPLSRVGNLSASSSSNSSSDGDSSDSESDSSPANNDTKLRLTNGHVNGSVPPADVLQADLELSDSASDSDC